MVKTKKSISKSLYLVMYVVQSLYRVTIILLILSFCSLKKNLNKKVKISYKLTDFNVSQNKCQQQ